jgi:Phosphodiester glycosidase
MTTILRSLIVLAVSAAVAGAAIGGAGAEPDAGGSGASLAVRAGGRWVTWWREDAAPVRWEERDATLADRVEWHRGARGVEWGELQLRGASEVWRTRLVLVRMDPRQVELALDPAFTEDRHWTVDDAGDEAAVAFAAGQFRETLPWGWVRTGGREILAPQYAPLAGAVVVDSAGAVRVVAPDSVAAEHRRGGAREAFQSYPMLLQDGAVPAPLRQSGLGVNVGHRDARLALCTLEDGRVVVALTRFDALGETLGRIPFGLTSGEMAAVMGGLGCRQALLLDGGISGQLRLADADGSVRRWPGTRSVPLGLVGRSR